MNSSYRSIHRPLWALAASALMLGGCANMTAEQQGTAQGAGIGAASGAVLGAVVGGRAGTGAVIGGVLGAVAGNIWSKRMEERKQAMEQATQGTGVEVSRTADNQLKLNIPSDISFDTGQSTIKSNLRPVLDQFAQGLNAEPNTEIRIVGHTDTTGSDAINNPLSVNRAASARNYLAQHGVDGRRIQIDGRGSYEPVAENSTDAGRARNRRIEIYLAERAAR